MLSNSLRQHIHTLVALYNKVVKKLSGAKTDYHLITDIVAFDKCGKFCPSIKPPAKGGSSTTVELIPNNTAPRKDILSPVDYGGNYAFDEYSLVDKGYGDALSLRLLSYLVSKRTVERQIIYIFDLTTPDNYMKVKKGTYSMFRIGKGADGAVCKLSAYLWDTTNHHTLSGCGSSCCIDDTVLGNHRRQWDSYDQWHDISVYNSWSVPHGQPYTDNPNWDNPAQLGCNYPAPSTNDGHDWAGYYWDSVVVSPPMWDIVAQTFTVDMLLSNNEIGNIVRWDSYHKERVDIPYLTPPVTTYTEFLESDWYVKRTDDQSGGFPVKDVPAGQGCDDGTLVGYDDLYQSNKVVLNIRAYAGYNGKAGECVYLKLSDTPQQIADKLATTKATGYGSGGGHIIYEEGVVLPTDLPNKGTAGVAILFSWCCNGIQL